VVPWERVLPPNERLVKCIRYGCCGTSLSRWSRWASHHLVIAGVRTVRQERRAIVEFVTGVVGTVLINIGESTTDESTSISSEPHVA
jgi:hypothetical protein